MNNSKSWTDIKEQVLELKVMVDTIDEKETATITDFGTLSFMTAILQEKIERYIRDNK